MVVLLLLIPWPGPMDQRPPCPREKAALVRKVVSKVSDCVYLHTYIHTHMYVYMYTHTYMEIHKYNLVKQKNTKNVVYDK